MWLGDASRQASGQFIKLLGGFQGSYWEASWGKGHSSTRKLHGGACIYNIFKVEEMTLFCSTVEGAQGKL